MFNPQLVPLSKVLYHTCFICGQRCKCWSRRPKLTSSVISDVKPIIYIFFFFNICGQRCKCLSCQSKLTSSVISDVKPIIYIFTNIITVLPRLAFKGGESGSSFTSKSSFVSSEMPTSITFSDTFFNSHLPSYIYKILHKILTHRILTQIYLETQQICTVYWYLVEFRN